MKINDILNLEPSDLMTLSNADLQKIARQTAKYTNTRINNLVRTKNTGSIAYQKLTASVRKTKKVTVSKTMTKAKLINQIQNNQSFLSDKTSTVGGWEKEKKKITKEFGKAYKRFVRDYSGHYIPEVVAKKRKQEHKKDRESGYKYEFFKEKQWTKIWEWIAKAKQTEPKINNFPSEMVKMVAVELFKQFSNISFDEFVRLLLERCVNEYERMQEEFAQMYDDITSGRKSTFHRKHK